MKNKTIKAGEVWETSGRRGVLTIRFLTDVDMSADGFFDAEIVEGKASYAGTDARLAQKFDGLGTPGTVESFRTTLVTLTKARPDLMVSA